MGVGISTRIKWHIHIVFLSVVHHFLERVKRTVIFKSVHITREKSVDTLSILVYIVVQSLLDRVFTVHTPQLISKTPMMVYVCLRPSIKVDSII